MLSKIKRQCSFIGPYIIIISIISSIVSFISFWNLQNSEWQQQEFRSANEMRISEGISSALKMLRSVDFEVFGRVQGVFFRKYTKDKGQQLGLKGWCMNTRQGTVTGTMQGKEEKIEEMKRWLQYTGSPDSKIEKCVFANDRHISKEEFEDFYIKKHGKFV